MFTLLILNGLENEIYSRPCPEYVVEKPARLTRRLSLFINTHTGTNSDWHHALGFYFIIELPVGKMVRPNVLLTQIALAI